MKPYARTLFDGFGYLGNDSITLNIGAPGPSILRKCAELMKKATDIRLDKELQGDAALLQYGTSQGDPDYIIHLSKFLSAEYGDPVDPDQLVTNSGATSGLHMIMTTMFPERCPVFIEDTTYFLAVRMFKEDFKFPLFPVTMDIDGINLDDFRRQLEVARKEYADKFPVPDHGYWAVLYCIPTFHNPTGRCLSDEKAKQLVDLAYENRILVLAEDVYNLLYYEGNKPPKRLFAYDRERAKAAGDENGGCVFSNATFSKLLTPGLRLGWLELPPWARKRWDFIATLYSGGCLNMYTSGIVASALETGLVTEFLRSVRTELKKRRDVVLEKLSTGLPKNCRMEVPKGGYFVWITLPNGIQASDVARMAKEKYKVLVHEGQKFCLPELGTKFGQCIRVSFSYHEADVLSAATDELCTVIRTFTHGHPTS